MNDFLVCVSLIKGLNILVLYHDARTITRMLPHVYLWFFHPRGNVINYLDDHLCVIILTASAMSKLFELESLFLFHPTFFQSPQPI